MCAQPWFGITVKPNGAGGICCEVTDELSGTNIRTHRFDELMQHDTVKRMRSEMLAGHKPKECWRCWDKEAASAQSLRQTLNREYFNMNNRSPSSTLH